MMLRGSPRGTIFLPPPPLTPPPLPDASGFSGMWWRRRSRLFPPSSFPFYRCVSYGRIGPMRIDRDRARETSPFFLFFSGGPLPLGLMSNLVGLKYGGEEPDAPPHPPLLAREMLNCTNLVIGKRMTISPAPLPLSLLDPPFGKGRALHGKELDKKKKRVPAPLFSPRK